MKKAIAVIAGTALALTLAGCGGQSEEAAESTQESQEATQAAVDETAAGNELAEQMAADTGAGEMYLKTAGGTSEGGNVPQVASSPDMQVMSIGLAYEGGDGSVLDIYVDGEKVTTINAAERMEASISLSGDALKEGEHMVEAVAMEGDEILIHKTARYEIVY